MSLTELLNIFSLAFGLFIAIIMFNLLLHRTVKSSLRALVFKLGLFLLFSLLFLLTPLLFRFMDVGSLTFGIKASIACLWWFSLNFLTNQLLTYFIWERLLPKKGITVSKLLRDLVAFILIIVTIACVFHFVFEKSVVGLFTASGVMAIILGYSAQATLGEAFAGVGLNITKQFDKDDWIELSGSRGKVVDINWRFVNLLTLDGNYLSIPNSQIAKEKITNYSRPSPIHGVTLKIQVPNTLSPETVKNLLISAATQSAKTKATPPPTSSLVEIQASTYHSYQLTYHTSEQNIALATDQILSIFWYQCQRVIKDAANTMSITTGYTEEDILIFLEKMDLFSSLDKEELSLLASQAIHRFYGPPERILTQGQSNQSLFLIYKGSVDVFITTPDEQEIKVASIPEGNYFGEMSLLTGDAAGASIIVSTESTIIEITHDNMAAIFGRQPALVEKMSEVIVQRKLQNETIRASLQSNIKKEESSLIRQLASRIKNFFKKTSTEQESNK
ncbi:MAG: mechanosensitive ion channel family protein [bacterium]|nr:mechanosensitive ion channel family protein [bacterium]